MNSCMKDKKLYDSDSDAIFIGWQETLSGEVIALYTITAAGHPSFGSTVTKENLNMLNLQIPRQHSTKSNRNRIYSGMRRDLI